MPKRVKAGTKPKRKLVRDMSPMELMELAFIRSRPSDAPTHSPTRHISDPVFGRLKWDVLWKGHVKDSPFGKKVPLSIEVVEEEAEPAREQRDAFARYRKVEKGVFLQVQRMLFDYYEANKEEFRSYPPAIRGANKRLADLTKPSDVWRVAKVAGIVVPVQRKKGRVVMLDFTTKWDQEHGTRALIQDGKATRLMDPGAGY